MSRKYLALGCAVLACAATGFASNIATIESNPSGTLVTLDSNPVITAIGSKPGTLDGYTYTNYAVIAQDGTGSLELFGHLPAGDSYVPAVGDTITAAGTYSPFNSIPELGTMTALSSTGTAAVPSPLIVTPAELQTTPTNSILGYVVELDDVLIAQQNTNNPVPGNFPTHANGTYTMTDASGQNPVTMFQYASSYSVAGALGGMAIPTGPVDITGIADVFGTTAEFIPFSITAVPEPTGAGILIAATALMATRRRNRRA